MLHINKKWSDICLNVFVVNVAWCESGKTLFLSFLSTDILLKKLKIKLKLSFWSQRPLKMKVFLAMLALQQPTHTLSTFLGLTDCSCIYNLCHSAFYMQNKKGFSVQSNTQFWAEYRKNMRSIKFWWPSACDPHFTLLCSCPDGKFATNRQHLWS